MAIFFVVRKKTKNRIPVGKYPDSRAQPGPNLRELFFPPLVFPPYFHFSRVLSLLLEYSSTILKGLESTCIVGARTAEGRELTKRPD